MILIYIDIDIDIEYRYIYIDIYMATQGELIYIFRMKF